MNYIVSLIIGIVLGLILGIGSVILLRLLKKKKRNLGQLIELSTVASLEIESASKKLKTLNQVFEELENK